MSGINLLFSRIWNFLQKEATTAVPANDADRLTPELIEQNIPYYLTSEAKEGLVKALRDFPENTQYYTRQCADHVLQGDGWTRLPLLNFWTGERDAVRGIVLSNTCDIAPENQRDLPYKMVFAPLMPLSAYVSLLERAGIEGEKIERKIAAIKRQGVSNIFYMPAGDHLDEEYITRLDDIHSIPTKAFFDETSKKKLFTLSPVGFYLFLFKLSVHFCRFHENVDRGAQAPESTA